MAAGVGINRFLGGEHPAVNWVLANVTEPVGLLFLRLLLMTVIPLVFSSLVVGVAGLGDVRKLGRIGLKSFAYCAVISAITANGRTHEAEVEPRLLLVPFAKPGLARFYGGM